MVKILKNGQIEFNLGSFHIKDFMNNDIVSLLEDFNYGLSLKIPVVLNIEMKKNKNFVICNLKECYILNENKKSIQTENIGLFKIGKTLYNDIFNQQHIYIEYISNIMQDIQEVKGILSLNLRSLKILLNQNDFIYKNVNINKSTLESLNNALYLHSIQCVYDKFENVESFRLFTPNRTYLILNTKIKKQVKQEFLVIEKSIIDIAINCFEELKGKRKLKQTQDLLEDLKKNLMEYNVRI